MCELTPQEKAVFELCAVAHDMPGLYPEIKAAYVARGLIRLGYDGKPSTNKQTDGDALTPEGQILWNHLVASLY
jgi:hypothetical protein